MTPAKAPTVEPGSSGIVTELRRLGVIPLIVIDDPGQADGLAQALVEGGLPCAEIAFRTPDAVEALGRIADEHPGVLVGAGTVLSVEQAAQASFYGARFIVSPGMNRRVVEFCLGQSIPVFPGACTPTEIESAIEMGLDVLKFFPAEPMGGLPFLKAIAAPYGSVGFIPTGGINAGNLAGYLRFDRVVACGGSWMAPQAWIAAGEFERIREATAEAVRIVRKAKGRK